MGMPIETQGATTIQPAPVSRRALLERAVGAAAAGAAGAATAGMLAPATALATDGDAVKAGQQTLAEHTTEVKYDGAGSFTGFVLIGNDSTYLTNTTFYPAAVGGWAGGGAYAGAGGVKTGVYGFTSNGSGYGVIGRIDPADGQSGGAGVFGITTLANGVGVRAQASQGTALEVLGPSAFHGPVVGTGSATFSGNATVHGWAKFDGRTSFARSGRASVPKNKKYVDVTVTGGLGSTANVLATLQLNRSGVSVAACRRDYPAAGKVRIYLNKVASTTRSTPVAWFVVDHGSLGSPA